MPASPNMNLGDCGLYLLWFFRTPGSELRFAQSSLLGLHAGDRQQIAVRSEKELLGWRRVFEFVEILECGAPKCLATPIRRLGVAILTARLKDQCAHRVRIGFPGIAIRGVTLSPIRVGAAARFLNEPADATRIGVGLGDIAHGDQRLREKARRIDLAAPGAGLVAVADDRLENRNRLFQIADGHVLQCDELADARYLPQLDRALPDLERLQPIGERLLAAGEQRAGIAAVVIELREI